MKSVENITFLAILRFIFFFLFLGLQFYWNVIVSLFFNFVTVKQDSFGNVLRVFFIRRGVDPNGKKNIYMYCNFCIKCKNSDWLIGSYRENLKLIDCISKCFLKYKSLVACYLCHDCCVCKNLPVEIGIGSHINSEFYYNIVNNTHRLG